MRRVPQMRPDVGGAARVANPEQWTIAKAAVVERLVGSGVDRGWAKKEVEKSYARLDKMIEAELRK